MQPEGVLPSQCSVYQADDKVYSENNLYNMRGHPVALHCLMPLTTEVSDQTSPRQSHLSSRIVFCLFPHSVPTYKLGWVVSLAHVYVQST